MKNLRPEVEKCLKSHRPGMHGITDLFDDLFITFYNITDDEFNYILEQATDDEIGILSEALGGMDSDEPKAAPFAVRRQALELRNFYLRKFGNL